MSKEGERKEFENSWMDYFEWLHFWKKKSIYCFGYISCFSEEPRFVLSFSSYTGLHILLYSWLCPFFSKIFFLKSSNVLCCREDTQKKHCGYFFLLTYILNQSWNWAQFYRESCGLQHIISFVFGWKRRHELENSTRGEWRPQVALLIIMYSNMCI